MRKTIILKSMFIFIMVLLILINSSYAIYHYKYKMDAFSLVRDDTPITYVFSRTNSTGYTNQDVEVLLDFNKVVEPIEGYEILDGGKRFRKIIIQNESNDFFVQDISGNKCNVSYDISNIDKIPPTIGNVEDGMAYSKPVNISYTDNIGISSIGVKRYNDLKWTFFDDYYDSSDYCGIQLLDRTILVNFYGKPRGTEKYNIYLNGVLKASIQNNVYVINGLMPYTDYTVRIDAVDSSGNVIQSKTKRLKTKLFGNIECVKNTDSFSVSVTGLDNRVKSANIVKFNRANPDYKIYQNVDIASDRSMQASMAAYDLGPEVLDTYYFLHFQLWDASNNLLETICINVEFGKNYIPKDDSIDVNRITESGEYDITATDFAGNQTFKSIIVN